MQCQLGMKQALAVKPVPVSPRMTGKRWQSPEGLPNTLEPVQ